MKTLKDIKQIVTKKGDDGTSTDYAGNTYPKSDPIFDCLGTIDELNSSLGVSYHYCHEPSIKRIQKTLQTIASLVATPKDHPLRKKIPTITDDDMNILETSIKSELNQKKIKPSFSLPGSEQSKQGAYLNLSRAVARRCERVVTAYIKENNDDGLKRSLAYLNRLSDYLYVLAED